MTSPEPVRTLDPSRLASDLRGGNRAALARAITLVESRRNDHQAAARKLVQALLPETFKSLMGQLKQIGAVTGKQFAEVAELASV